MADRPSDHPDNQDSYSKHFKRIATLDTGNSRKGAAAFIGAPMGLAAIMMSPLLFVPSNPTADPDLYTGIMNDTKTYSYVQYSGAEDGIDRGWYLILNDDGKTRLYQREQYDEERLFLVEDADKAATIISAISTEIKKDLTDRKENPRTYSPMRDIQTNTSTCDYISQPFEHFGTIERFKDGCPINTLKAHEYVDFMEAELAQWTLAEERVAADAGSYGVDQGDIIDLKEATAPSFGTYAGATLALGGMASLMFGAGLAGAAGMSYSAANRRRRKNKKNGQTPK